MQLSRRAGQHPLQPATVQQRMLKYRWDLVYGLHFKRVQEELRCRYVLNFVAVVKPEAIKFVSNLWGKRKDRETGTNLSLYQYTVFSEMILSFKSDEIII